MVVKLPCERKHEFQIMHCIVGFAARSRGFYPLRRGDSYNYTEAFRALQTRIICSTSHNILGVYFHENLIHENSFILRKFLKTQGAALPVKYRSSNAFLTLKCARIR